MTPPDDPHLRAAWVDGARQMAEVLVLRYVARYGHPHGGFANALRGWSVLELEPITGESAAEYRWLDNLTPLRAWNETNA